MVGKWYYASYGESTVLGKCVGENDSSKVLEFRWGDPWRKPHNMSKHLIISEGQDPRYLARIWKTLRKLFEFILAVLDSLRTSKKGSSRTLLSHSKYQFINSKKVPCREIIYNGELNSLLRKKGIYDQDLETLWYFKIRNAQRLEDLLPVPKQMERRLKYTQESSDIENAVNLFWNARFKELSKLQPNSLLTIHKEDL